MFSRNTISFALAGILFLQSIGFSSAQSVDNSDKEYDAQVQEDMRWVTGNEWFARIEKSVDKNLFDTKDAKLARKTAKDYIESLKPYDSHWKWNNPKLVGKPVPYYTDNSSTPISYEWKVKCSNTNDCGSIIVVVADNVARVMEAGTYGTANYERLGGGKETHKNKLYYYSAFDQYIESTSGNDTTVDAIDPGKQLYKTSSERKDELKSRKDSVNSLRKSEKISFQETDTILTTSVPLVTSSIAPTSSLAVTAAAATVMDVQHMTPTTNCSSAVPCYDQFSQIYGTGTCLSWCSPTAMAIIFWYYDRMGIFPNLIGNSSTLASDWIMDTSTINMVNIIRWHMKTKCSINGAGSTIATDIKLWMQYARTRGYTNSLDGTFTSAVPWVLFPKIRAEINGAKPLIATFGDSSSAHSVIIFWYNDTGVISTSQVHINYGWGKTPDRYVSIYNQLTSADLMLGYKLRDITTVPVKN